MRLIIAPRQAGKTHMAIVDAHESGAYMVVRSQKEAQRCFRLAAELGYPIALPITFDEFAQGRFSARGCRAFVVDGVEALIQMLARGADVVSITLEDEAKGGPR